MLDELALTTNEISDMKWHLKFPNVATRTDNIEWYSSLPLHAVVPLSSMSAYWMLFYWFSEYFNTVSYCIFIYTSQSLLHVSAGNCCHHRVVPQVYKREEQGYSVGLFGKSLNPSLIGKCKGTVSPKTVHWILQPKSSALFLNGVLELS